jgi:hypothetical protein
VLDWTGKAECGAVEIPGPYASLIMLGDDDGAFVDIATPLTLSDRAFKVQYVAPAESFRASARPSSSPRPREDRAGPYSAQRQ